MLGCFVQVYCDDILIFSKTREEHVAHVRMVLETLRHHKLNAKASKCHFGRAAVGFLGHFISEHGVAVDPSKVVAAIANLASPTSCTEVRRFVGLRLANYYRKFVLRFSALAAPLTALCSPRATFRWGAAEEQSFTALRAALTSVPVLRVWDPMRPTRLLTDASELAVSAILEQPDDTGAYHPLAFESRKLTPPERLYPPHLLELLAVVHALKTLRPYPHQGSTPVYYSILGIILYIQTGDSDEIRSSSASPGFHDIMQCIQSVYYCIMAGKRLTLFPDSYKGFSPAKPPKDDKQCENSLQHLFSRAPSMLTQ